MKSINDYHYHLPQLLHGFQILPSLCYSWNSIPLYQAPIIVEDSFITPRSTVPINKMANPILHEKSHRYKIHIRKQDKTYGSIDSNVTPEPPLLNVNQKSKAKYRQKSQKHLKRQDFIKRESSQQPFLSTQQSETIENNPRSEIFSIIDGYCSILRDRSDSISNQQFTDILNKLTLIMKNFDYNDQQQWIGLTEMINTLIDISPSMLISASQNEIFSVLQILFIDILRQWHHRSILLDHESFMFRSMIKLMSIIINNISNINQIPSWIYDSMLLGTIADCLRDIATSGKYLDDRNNRALKNLTRLIELYADYQQRLNDKNHTNKEKLVRLLDPIVDCLNSSHYIYAFTNLSHDAESMTTTEKFFLLKCPSFLISYNGSRLEEIMEDLLSSMLPQYVKLLEKIIPSVQQWNQATIQVVNKLLQIINHGANELQTNTKIVAGNLSLINHVLNLVNQPILYDNLRETLSNPETILMNTAISFLVNMISEPAIMAHIKQTHVALAFLRLTKCPSKPLVLNVYTLLAYTTHEEDIKAMQYPGRLLSTVIESIKLALDRKSGKGTQIEQLFETLKGLVQHDQIKDEIIKQRALPYLLECTNKLTDRSLILIYETLWSLAFFEEIARILRANSKFLDRIQTISKDNRNEPLKKAVDGLVWKLIQEPIFLEKVSRQEDEDEDTEDIDENIAQVDKSQIGTIKKQRSMTPERRNATPLDHSSQYDIMISYCHADKELTYKIHRFLLKQNFKVWIDLDNMYGPAMSAMAEAVENSEFVIMCMSDAYKQSAYCQAEAEYAFKCKRRLIPLVLRQGYKPDGWLGLMIGSRIYIDFGRHDFDTACEKLITEINLQRKKKVSLTAIDTAEPESIPEKPITESNPNVINKKTPLESSLNKPSNNKDIISSVIKARQANMNFMRKSVNQWTEYDVIDFLMINRLHQLVPLCEYMNGRALIELYNICTPNKIRAYTVLKDELNPLHKSKLSISVYTRFLSMLEESIKNPPPISSNVKPSPPKPPLPLSSSTAAAAKPVTVKTNPIQTCSTMPFVPAPSRSSSYDFSIITNASALDTLKMVERYGSQLINMDSLRRRITTVS